MTPAQLQLLGLARRQAFAKNDDASYRLLLRNVAGVASSKELTNATFEDVMAVLEDSGFTDRVHGPGHWQRKVSRRGHRAGERLVHKIDSLSRHCDRYPLAALCRRVSADRATLPGELTPREAWNLIEMLKDVIEREPVSTREPQLAKFADDVPF